MKAPINPVLQPLFSITEQWFLNFLKLFVHELSDNLTEKAENTRSVAVQSDCFTAMYSLQKNSSEASAAFITALAKNFQTLSDSALTEKNDTSNPFLQKKETLNLIATNDLEENLSFDTAVEKVKKLNKEPFDHLEARIFSLLEAHNERVLKSPLSAENILEAFRDTMEIYDFSPDMRIHTYKLFEKYLSSEVGDLLQKLNADLITKNILPEVITDFSIKKENNNIPTHPAEIQEPIEQEIEQLSTPELNQPTAHENSTGRSAAGLPINTPVGHFQQGNSSPGNSSEMEVAQSPQNQKTSVLSNRHLDLARQLSGKGRSAPASTSTDSRERENPDVNHSILKNNAANNNINSAPANLNSLKQIYQAKQQTISSFSSEHETSTQELILALTDIQYNFAAEAPLPEVSEGSIVEQIKENILTQTDKTSETTQLKNNKLYLIDMIEDLFTHIADNKKLSSSAKELFRRLMIPIIHLSLIDETFIDNELHAARKFLDNFSNASLGITDTSDKHNNPTYLKLKKIALQLGNKNKINSTVFTELNDDLERFVHYRKQKAQKAKPPEKLALSNRIDTIIEHCIKGKKLPDGIITFLEKIWKNVMLKAYLDINSSSEKRARSTAFISSLIFSLKPASNAIELSRLKRLIPVINNELVDGLEDINCPSPIREKCTHYLNRLHQTALTMPTLEKNDTTEVEEEIIYRNELFDDSKTSSNTSNNLSSDKEIHDLAISDLPEIQIEPQAKTVSSLEDAFIEEPSAS
ncbi:MAG: DUF1631 domain-containing protein, partial [Gammaproteobacteria bacterium]|nr:DUF1631 domain-containing protein [Gammaproteobacteria bacterium]